MHERGIDMAKSRAKKPIEVEDKPKPKKNPKVKFIKDFEGLLNNKKFSAKKGDALEVLPSEAEWLKNKGAI